MQPVQAADAAHARPPAPVEEVADVEDEAVEAELADADGERQEGDGEDGEIEEAHRSIGAESRLPMQRRSGADELPQLHVEHTGVLDALAAGPRQVRARESLTSKKQVEAEAEQQAVTDLKKASDERALQLKTNEMRLIDLRSKLNIRLGTRTGSIDTATGT